MGSMCKVDLSMLCVVVTFTLCFSYSSAYQYPVNWNNWIIVPSRTNPSDTIINTDLKYFDTIDKWNAETMSYIQTTTMPSITNNTSESFVPFVETKDEVRNIFENELFQNSPDSSKNTGIELNKEDNLFLRIKSAIDVMKEILIEANNPESRKISSQLKQIKVKRKFKKFMLPLLLAYKLKFFTLIPVFIGGLILLAGSTGMAGFFFALFAAVMSLKSDAKY